MSAAPQLAGSAGLRRGTELMLVALVTAMTLLSIWIVHWRWMALVPALGLVVAGIWAAHRDTLHSLGLTLAQLQSAARAWQGRLAALTLVMVAAVVSTVPASRLLSTAVLARSALYLGGCFLQQTLFQNAVYRGLARVWGHGWASRIVAGLLFSVAHLPNPVLVPATLAWGVVSCRLFDQQRSVPAIAASQWLLSNLLFVLAPASLHHGFRVGPGYWTYPASEI